MASAARVMIPKRQGAPLRQKRDLSDPKRTFAVRLGGDARDWVEDAEEAGIGYTSLFIQVIETSMSMSKELGDLWWEIERRAKVEGAQTGVVIARLVKAALESEKTQRPRK